MTTIATHTQLELQVGDPIGAGNLLLFPLFTSAAGTPDYLCGPRLDSAVHVGERDGGAAVPELHVENLADIPVLFIEGEVLLGANQNRTLNVSVLCAAGALTVLPVSCVEAGRWGNAKVVAKSARHAPIGLRREKTRSVVDSVRAFGRHDSDQGVVWDEVRAYAASRDVSSPTSALEDVYLAAEPDISKLVAGLRPVDHQCGVVVATGNTLSLDLFDKPTTLAAYWDGLVAGYALEALDRPAIAIDRLAIEGFIDAVLSVDATKGAAVGLGHELHFESEELVGSGLTWEGTLVHLTAFAGTN